jgi:hypothetical protein
MVKAPTMRAYSPSPAMLNSWRLWLHLSMQGTDNTHLSPSSSQQRLCLELGLHWWMQPSCWLTVLLFSWMAFIGALNSSWPASILAENYWGRPQLSLTGYYDDT